MNTVAPNSPSDTAKANPAATASARRTIGRSTSRHTRHGDAPSTAAASRSRSSTARSTGSMVRITNGTPTSACASGTRIQLVRRSSGGSSRATRKPKPTVTAETPSGSISSASNPRTSRPASLRVSAAAARPPISRAMAVAATAYSSEVPIASIGGTRNTLPSSEVSAR